jgi:hypothetical protein
VTLDLLRSSLRPGIQWGVGRSRRSMHPSIPMRSTGRCAAIGGVRHEAGVGARRCQEWRDLGQARDTTADGRQGSASSRITTV